MPKIFQIGPFIKKLKLNKNHYFANSIKIEQRMQQISCFHSYDTKPLGVLCASCSYRLGGARWR